MTIAWLLPRCCTVNFVNCKGMRRQRKWVAVPTIVGMVSSIVLTLVVIPAIYVLMLA